MYQTYFAEQIERTNNSKLVNWRGGKVNIFTVETALMTELELEAETENT